MKPRPPRATKTAFVRDLVCGAQLDPAVESFATRDRGEEYRFCSLACRRSFEEDPERFLSRRQLAS